MMPVNRMRGEVPATLEGRDYKLRLTLGGLAELEDYFACSDLVSLSERLEQGRLSARDCIAIMGIGLRGAGHQLTNDEVANLLHDDGAGGYVAIVADLLSAAFGPADDQTSQTQV